LDYLNENYKLHIITNGFAEVQGRKIKNAKLHDYFHTITNSDMAGVKNPIIFEYALDLAKANKKQHHDWRFFGRRCTRSTRYGIRCYFF
jgi:putative hydrolase of the HAD superfamily